MKKQNPESPVIAPKEMPKKRERLSGVSLPRELKVEFRKMCIVQDIKPYNVIRDLIRDWIAKERSKYGLK